MINQTPTLMTNQSIGTSYGRVIRKRQQLGGKLVTLETFKAMLAQQIEAGKLSRDDANERYKWANGDNDIIENVRLAVEKKGYTLE